MASASADPAVRALGLRFEFTQVVPSSGLAIALEELFDTPTPEEALAAAEFVGQHADQATRRLLSRKLIEASHSDGWGFAVALAKSGQTWALDEWAKNTELLVATNHDSTTLLLHLVLLSPSRATVRVGIAAAHSPGVTARLAAIRILRFGATREVVDTLRFLTQDRESSVRTAAQSELERRAKPNID